MHSKSYISNMICIFCSAVRCTVSWCALSSTTIQTENVSSISKDFTASRTVRYFLFKILFLCLNLLVAVLPLICESIGQSQEIDPSDLAIAETNPPKLIWENIEANSDRLFKTVPKYHRRSGLHLVSIKSGQAAYVKVAKNSQLRVFSPYGNLEQDDFQFLTSNGSAAFVQRLAVRSSDRKSLVIGNNSSNPILVKVLRPQTLPNENVAIFLSRWKSTARKYYERVHCANDIPVTEANWSTASKTVSLRDLQPNQQFVFKAESKVLYRLESRVFAKENVDDWSETYEISLELGTENLRRFRLTSTPNLDSTFTLDGKPASVTQRRVVYFYANTDETARVQCDRRMLIQIEKIDPKRYRYSTNVPPWMERIEKFTTNVSSLPSPTENSLPLPSPPPSRGNDSTDDSFVQTVVHSADLMKIPYQELANIKSIARRFTEQSHRSQGGLLGYHLLNAAAFEFPAIADFSKHSNRFRQQHNKFSTVSVFESNQPISQTPGYFVTPKISDSDPKLHNLSLQLNLAKRTLGLISKANFYDLSHEKDAPTIFRWNPGNVPAQIRFALASTAAIPTKLWIQTGNRIQEVHLEPLPQELTTTPHVAQNGLQQFSLRRNQKLGDDSTTSSSNSQQSLPPTLDGPFDQRRQSYPMLDVSTFEIALPLGISELKMWAGNSSASNPISVKAAVQVLTSRQRRMDERSYLDLAISLSDLSAVSDRIQFFNDLLQLETESSWSSFQNRYLANLNETEPSSDIKLSWQNFARLLHANRKTFLERLAKPPEINASLPSMSAERVRQTLKSARYFQSKREWLIALEKWSQVVPFLAGQERREGHLGQIQAAIELKEFSHARRLMRGLIAFADDEILKSQVYRELEKMNSESNSKRDALSLAAFWATENPTAISLKQFAKELQVSNHLREALMVSLLVPKASCDWETIIECCCELKWWSLFELAHNELPEDRKKYWNARRAITTGELSLAVNDLNDSGLAGTNLLSAIESAKRIRNELSSGSQLEKGILDWEAWSRAHPGPKKWKASSDLVSHHYGSISVASGEDGTSKDYFVTDSKRPIELLVNGPKRLKLSCRIRHQDDDDPSVDDWVHLKYNGMKRFWPINGSQISPTLRAHGRANLRIGSLSQYELSVGPGLHRIKLWTSKRTGMIRVAQELPKIHLGILANINRHSMQSIISSNQQITQRLSLRLDPKLAGQRGVELTNYENHWSDSEKLIAVNRIADRNAKSSALNRLITDPGISTLSKSGLIAAKGELLQALLTLYSSDQPNDQERLELMRLLALISEVQPDYRTQCCVTADELISNHRCNDEIKALYRRIIRPTTWRRIASVDEGAGVFDIQLEKNKPESSSRRIANALLPLNNAERVLSGSEELLVNMSNIEQRSFSLTANLAAPVFRPSTPTMLNYQIGNQPSQTVLLYPNQSNKRLDFDVPKGRHAIRIWIENPLLWQYVTLQQVSNTGWNSSGSTDTEVFHETIRRYHVATQSEPVALTVKGPTILRVDQYVAGETVSKKIYVNENLETLELRPSPNNPRAYFRIFQMEVDETLPRLFSPELKSTAPEKTKLLIGQEVSLAIAATPISDLIEVPKNSTLGVGQPVSDLNTAKNGSNNFVDLDRGLPLGGQEDNTWSLRAGYVSRRALDEGITGGRADQFAEARGIYESFNESFNSFHRAELITRSRARFGGTLGFRNRFRAYDPSRSTYLEFDSSGYLQKPSEFDALGNQSNTQWSISGKVLISHRQAISDVLTRQMNASIFGRELSLERNSFGSSLLDQDVFTSYKSDHRSGFTISEKWLYQPWLDSRFWVRPSLISNEDFDPFSPDRISFKFGADQAIGSSEIKIGYALNWYFEDDDRRTPQLQNLISLGSLTSKKIGRRRTEIDLKVLFDVDSGETAAAMHWSIFLDNGRGYRDLYPGSRIFPGMRQENEESIVDSGGNVFSE